jgi:hypothetical protein
MTTDIVDHADAKTVGATCGARIKLTWPAFALVGIFAALGAAGCEGYHSRPPGPRSRLCHNRRWRSALLLSSWHRKSF